MKQKSLIFVLFVLFVLTGCDKTKYFEPSDIAGTMKPNNTLPSSIKDASREGAILNNDMLITKAGLLNITLEENSKFYANDGTRYLLQKDCSELIILNANTKTLDKIPSKGCIASGNLFGNIMAVLYADNSISIFDISTKAETELSSFNKTIGSTNLVAKPEFFGKLIVFPTLNGKIVVYDASTQKPIKDITISSEKFFNNINYLKILDNGDIIAATAKRLSVIQSNNVYNFDNDLRDVKYQNGFIYVLLNSGEIIKFDPRLNKILSKKFPFAILSGIVVTDSSLYVSERNGYLLELNINTFESKVYKSSIRDTKVFYNDNSIFFGKHFIRF